MKNYRHIVFLALAILAASTLWGMGIGEVQTPQFEPAKVISTAPALYPINSVAWGTVILEVQLSQEGAIDAVKVLHGIPSLTGPAVTAVKKWKFGAARLNGQRIASSIPVAFTFVPPNVGPRI